MRTIRTAEAAAMLAVHDVCMVFPNGFEALDPVSFAVERGEFVCIIGRSGAGKSTLLRCLNGFLIATGGTLVVEAVVRAGSVRSFAPGTGDAGRTLTRLNGSLTSVADAELAGP